jgi:hypothetical protein
MGADPCACGKPDRIDSASWPSGVMRHEHGVDFCVYYYDPWFARYYYTEPVPTVDSTRTSPGETEG